MRNLAHPRRVSSVWANAIVIAAAVSWDDPWKSEHQMALALSKRVPVIFVDPPVSVLTPLRKPNTKLILRSALQRINPRLARVTPLSLPGVSRPLLHDLSIVITRRAIASAVRRLGASVDTIVAASFDHVLHSCAARERVLWATDDWIAGANLMGISTRRLELEEARQLRSATVVLAVSEQLANRWATPARTVHVLPGGCNADAFAKADSLPVADDVRLSGPAAGFVGHISDRIDIDLLKAVADSGLNLLLVGPVSLTSKLSGFDELVSRPNVQWTGAKPFAELPHYVAAISVGLTPYTSSDFNQSSYPLKTIEYLAAGLPVVSSDLPASRSFPPGLIQIARTPDEFASMTRELVDKGSVAADRVARLEFASNQSWDARASQLLSIVRHPAAE